MKSIQKPQREKLDAIYIVRALAIIGVILVHTTSIPIEMVAPESKTFAIYHSINIFNKFGTPTFIFLSAFVLFYSYFYRPFTKQLIWGFYKRRVQYVLLPYLIFSLGYYGLRTYYLHGTGWEGVINHASLTALFQVLLTGKAFYHLYFVFINIQFYLLFPALLWLLQRYSRMTRHLIWAGIILQWAFVLMNHWQWQYADKGSLCLSYISYYFLGAFLGIHYEDVKKQLASVRERLRPCQIGICLVWGTVAAGNIYIWYLLRTGGVVLNVLVYEALWHFHAYITALLLFWLASFLVERLNGRWTAILMHFGAVSFGIYLLHAGLLTIYFGGISAGNSPLVYHSLVAGGFLWTVFCSWVIVSLAFQLTDRAWILFGPVAKPFYRIGEVQKTTMYTGDSPGTEYQEIVKRLSQS